MYKINSKKPIPTIRRGRKAIYPVRELEIGESFCVNVIGKRLECVRGAIYAFAGRIGIKVTTSVDNGVLTVWRAK